MAEENGETPEKPMQDAFSPRFVIGLDLVFSGLSGYAVSKFEEDVLLAYGLLTEETQATSDAAKKVARSQHLTRRLWTLFRKASPAICVIEKPRWKQKVSENDHRAAGRERNAIRSLALARGLAVASALCSEAVLPIYMDVATVRKTLLGMIGRKEALFAFINFRYQLGLGPTDANMNLTDGVALTTAFHHISNLPHLAPLRKTLEQETALTRQACQSFQKTLPRLFGVRSIAELAALRETDDPRLLAAVARAHKRVEKGLVKGVEIAPRENYFISIDISARHPGVIVAEVPSPDAKPEIVYHKTFSIEQSLSEVESVYDTLVAANLILAVTSLALAFSPKGIIFEYTDWHRVGFGLDYHVDVAALNSLNFTYGVLMALASILGVPLFPVNATDAKKLILGKRNATKNEVKAHISQAYPLLKNEHTRDAALLLEYWLKTRNNTVNTPPPASKKPPKKAGRARPASRRGTSRRAKS